LPNGNILPTAGTSAESSEEIFPYRTGSVTKLGPQISLFPVPILGVNAPLLHINSFPAVPLSRTEVVAEFMRDSTHKIHLAGKPLALSISNTIENSTRSNAFSKSSFRITISVLD
jgi:hypothetical protein